MNHIFISYRRKDAIDVTGRINDLLQARFGKGAVFMDFDKLSLGTDFRVQLEKNVGQCKILLAVIGQNWLTSKDKKGCHRLENPGDFVRIEIESALQRNIPVIPLLVQGAEMPSSDELPAPLKKLAFRNGTKIRPDPDFHKDMNRLIGSVEQHLRSVEKDIWMEIKNSDSIESYDNYLICFPNGAFTREAGDRIQALKKQRGNESTDTESGTKLESNFISSGEIKSQVLFGGRDAMIMKRLTLMLIIFVLIALGIFFASETNSIRLASVIPTSLIGVGLIIIGLLRRKILEIALGITGALFPWLLALLARPMTAIAMTAAIVVILGFFVLKDLRELAANSPGES